MNKRKNNPEKPKFSASDLEDLNALASIKKGDAQAYAVIFKKYRWHLRYAILRTINDQSVVDDLLMEVFEKAYENIGKYRQEYTFNAWLTRVAQNYVLDYIRKKKTHPTLYNTVSLNEPVISPKGEETTFDIDGENPVPMGTTAELTYEVKVKYLYDTIAMLPQINREVLELRLREKLSIQEIADKLGIGLSAAKLRLKRGQEFLLTIISKRQGEFLVDTTHNWESLYQGEPQNVF